MEYKLRKAEPRDVPDILRLVKVGLWDLKKKPNTVLGINVINLIWNEQEFNIAVES